MLAKSFLPEPRRFSFASISIGRRYTTIYAPIIETALAWERRIAETDAGDA